MKEIRYTITDPCGIHARPAGKLVRLAQGYPCTVTMQRGEKSCDMKNLLQLMGLGAKAGETVAVQAAGPDEELCAAAVAEFLQNNL